MKQKKNLLTVALVLLVCAMMGGYFILQIFRTPVTQVTPPRGMFEWDENAVYAPQDAQKLITQLSLTRWYQEFPDDALAMATFTEFLHKQNMQVYALLGSVEWGFEADGASLTQELTALVQYNDSVNETQRLDGVMVDVEPYTSSRFKKDPENAMRNYVDGMTSAYEAVQDKGLSIIMCIPRHYDERGLTAELERLIAGACDEVAVMNYECGKEVEKIETEAAFAAQYDKELHCILEFQAVGKHGLTEEKTYRNKGVPAAQAAFAAVDEAYPHQSVVWDYHWTKPLREMAAEQDD